MPIRLILLLTLAILTWGRSPAQDILFKSNGEKIKVHIVERNDRSISYLLPGQANSPVHHISTSVLDSVLLQDGNRLLFTGVHGIAFLPEIPEPEKFGHHLVGFDWSAAAFYHSLAFSYEYLLFNYRLGIKAVYGKNLESNSFYDNSISAMLSSKGSYFRAGVHWYIFPPGTFRFGAGLHYMTARYHVSGERTIYNPNPPYDITIQTVDENRNYRNLILDFIAYYQVFRNVAINASLDMLNKTPEGDKAVLRAEVLINF